MMKIDSKTLIGTFAATVCLNADAGNVETATLKIQPNVELELRAGPHAISDVDRERYFRTYHIPGMFTEEQAVIMQELGVSPGRGTGPYFAHSAGDTERAGWDPVVKKQFEKYTTIYQKADERYPGVIHALAGGNYPQSEAIKAEGDEVEVDATMIVDHKNGVKPEDFAANVDLIDRWISAIKESGATPPKYFSPLNEPDAGWKGSPNPPDDHSQFARQLALAIQDKHPEVMISGPSSAWGHPRADWKRWTGSGWERRFIEQVGDIAGAYDLHIYSKEYWAGSAEHSRNFDPKLKQPTPSMYDSFLNGNLYVWDFGKIDSFLDLMYAHHQDTWDEPSLPVIITEFGRQGITPQKGPWFNDYAYYLYGTTVTRLWMAFMDRPEIELTVPFILPVSDPGYAQQRGQALFNRPDYPDSSHLEATLLLDFYRFYRGFEGVRVPAKWEGIDADNQLGHFAIAVRQGDELWVLLHNAPDRELKLNLDLGFPVKVGDARIARMRWEGAIPEDYTATELNGEWRIDFEAEETIDLSNLVLAPEETAIVKVKLPDESIEGKRIEERIYADKTIQPLGKEPVEYHVDLGTDQVAEDATLVVSVAAPKGFKAGTILSATINGYTQKFDLGIAEGSVDLLAPVRLPVPAEALKAGDNVVSIELAEGKAWNASIGSLRIDTVRIN
ncbi:hypothetical protein [Rubellicoccus peritrichatus]|uniref:Uncharacterized protein n=1 Tax=Rubellicoccus peritrichatus TaxID=3080537 RepID=A0AAQ3LK23_9BACT|nr:hypothetical protein [Puniceicoccus sp. CR14]WOO43699.1 hypothetical protein RZN69_11425 [Puniceicoccus sp. CR14]